MAKEYIHTASSEIEVNRRRVMTRKLNSYRKRSKAKNIAELQNRFDEHFEWCAENDVLPTMELIASCQGVSVRTFERWCLGQHCTKEWQQICISARQLVHASVEQAGADGDLSAPLTIFWQKGFGWSDQKSLEDSAAIGQSSENVSYALPSEILRKYLLEPKESISEDFSASRSEDNTPRWLLEDSDEPENFDWMPPIIE